MMAKSVLLAIFLLLNTIAWGQASKLVFEKTEHDFGELEEGINGEYQFRFKNTGNAPIRLTDVRASCGCTTPEWSKEDVAPGKTGYVKAIYNTQGRPGGFQKSITVLTSGSQEPIILTIKGTVKTNPNNIYVKDTLGSIAFETLFLPLNQISSTETKENAIKFKNISKNNVNILDKMEKNPAFDVKFDKKVLKPGEVATMTIITNGGKANWKHNALFNESIAFYTDEGKKQIAVNGTFIKIFTQQELAAMPKIEFEKLEFDAGNIIQGEKVNYAFKFKNTGGSTLIIESAKPSCGCTASAPKENQIPPNANSQIEMTFDSNGRKGPQSKTITVVSNDPSQPNVVLKFKCNVETNPFSGGFNAK